MKNRVRALLRAVKPWFDPRSRRPLVLIAVVSLAVFLGPLAADVASAWFFAIPWGLRWSLAQAALVAAMAVGVARLCRVRPRDTWPSAAVPDDLASRWPAAQWMPWALRLTVASLAIPMMANPEGLGFADWDFVLDKFEAVRRTILVWHQFPWWNPWCRGGFPLAAEPQIGAVSMATPLILALGTTTGLRIATVLCAWIAIEGAYLLALLWFREPWAAAAAALVYGLNGAVSVSIATGYIIAMSYCSLPWLAYHTFRIGGGFTQSVALGFWMAFTLLNGLQYISLYAMAFVAAIAVRAVRIQPPGSRVVLLRNATAGMGCFLLLAGWRLATVYLVMRDDRREAMTSWDEPLTAIGRHLLSRPTLDWPAIAGRHWDWYVSVTSYVGPAVILLVLLSLTRGWRWWHALVLVSGWLAIGSRQWYHPSLWLADWPLIGSAHVVTRWRFLAMLGLGLAAGSMLAHWRGSRHRMVRLLAAGLTLAIGADLLALAHQQARLAFSVPPDPRCFPGAPVAEIVNVRDGLGYPCVLRGYGVIRGYEPMLSYRRDAPTLRRAREDRHYRGESWTDDGEVRPVFWSPNRLVFRVKPGEEVSINQNPGSWWLVNGRRMFPERRCAEPMVPFVVAADDNGRLELRIDPPGLALGIGLELVGAAMLAAAWPRARSRRRPIRCRGEAPLATPGESLQLPDVIVASANAPQSRPTHGDPKPQYRHRSSP
jgi:hypothetical protein